MSILSSQVGLIIHSSLRQSEYLSEAVPLWGGGCVGIHFAASNIRSWGSKCLWKTFWYKIPPYDNSFYLGGIVFLNWQWSSTWIFGYSSLKKREKILSASHFSNGETSTDLIKFASPPTSKNMSSALLTRQPRAFPWPQLFVLKASRRGERGVKHAGEGQ